jgi:F-type H+-transporting ATPase subunit b
VNVSVTLLQATTTKLGAAPRSAEAQLLDIDGTVFVMLGIFLVLLLVLWQFLWKPYLRVRDERVARVEGAREKATQLEADAAARLERIETALAEARRAGLAETNKLRLEAQAREQQIVTQAQNAARKMVLEARAKLDATLLAEKANLQTHTNHLARQIAEKALGRSLAS